MAGAVSLIEREDALETLLALAAGSATGSGQIAVVSGESGLGKTTLLEALSNRLGDQFSIPWGRCDDLFTPRQLGPFSDIAPLLGNDVENALASHSPPAALFPQVLAALSTLPAGTPVVFEDVHWADHASLDLLKFVARRVVALRILIVLTYRPDELGAAHPLNSLLGDLPAAVTTRIELRPLSREAVARLADEAGRDGVELYRITGGNPFFVSEILAETHDPVGLPSSVRDAVLARAARVAAPERQLLDALCVAPELINREVIERLAGTEGLEACAALEGRGLLVREAGGELRFRHEMARIAMLNALPAAERHAHHRRLLDVYRQMGAAIKPDLIVHHAAAINDAPVVLRYAPLAAARAGKAGACKEAAAQLIVALKHVDTAEPELAARLYEDWAYQASLFEVTDEVIAARHEAVRRWRALARPERVGDNLRWLWRLHWYRGETDEAQAVAAESLEILEAIPPSIELASAYSLRAQLSLMRGQRGQSITWGQKAVVVAEQFNDVATQVQALVTVATAMLFDGDDRGRSMMEKALRLANAHGLHEEIARIHTNYAEYCMLVSDWQRAEQLIRDGLAFDIKHGLDAWTTYLKGRHAQLHLLQGRLAQAVTLARSVLAEEGHTILMRLPALTTLATVRSRLGEEDAETLLEEILQIALGMREQQRITPVRLALIQHHYLRGSDDIARQHAEAMRAFGTEVLRPWDAGALRVWIQRLGLEPLDPDETRATPAQELELAGDYPAAAAALDALTLPFEAAVCRLAGTRSGAPDLARQAADGFAAIDCQPGVDAVKRGLSPQIKLSSRRPGPYGEARQHPLGLTRREVEILALMAEGASNADIAENLSRSPRTVEHHVSSILGKLSAANRLEATLRVIAEPWIVQQ